MPTTDHDHVLATELATAAGHRLLELRERGDGDAAALRAEGDRTSHEFLMAELARERPDDAVLSEEGADNPARLDAARVWIVDPLDGTREFSEPGRTDWAVHVALAIDGDAVVGAVALPAAGVTLGSGDPSSIAPAAGVGEAPRMVVSRTRPPALIEPVASALGAVLVPMGSAGAKAMAVVQGDADIYLHAGGQYEWDSAAPVAVAKAHGLHTSRIDGSPLRYNARDPLLPDLLICRADLADAVLTAIAAASSSSA